MLNDPTGATAEGLPKFTRRKFLATSAGASASVAIGTRAASAASSMAELIEAHRQAHGAWGEALERVSDCEQSLEESLKADPIDCRIDRTHGRYERWDIPVFDRYECKEKVYYITRERACQVVSTVSGLDVAEATKQLEALAELERQNLQAVNKAHDALDERKAACGLTAAQDRACECEDREREALMALLEHRPATLQEASDRAAYLLAVPLEGQVPDDEEIRKLLISLAGGRV